VPMSSTSARTVRRRPILSLIHRELIQLAFLIGVAVVGFLLTRTIAASNREMNIRDGAEWYARGNAALAAGDPDRAVDAFRRATLKNRHDSRYVLALAGALARTHQEDAARTALLTLRESAPEDPEVNLQLARLDAARHDLAEATRYYHNALYAAWPEDRMDTRRDVRLELVRLLLANDQSNRAVSELVALATDLPEDAAAHVTVGELFAKAGDYGRALDQFQRALRLDADNGRALAGAGEAALRLGDYAAARDFLHRAPDSIAGAAEGRELVDLVLSQDPLASRIGVSARRQRLVDNLEYASQRLDACVQHGGPGGSTGDADTLRSEVQPYLADLKRSRTLEADTIETGVDLGARIEARVAQRCGPPSPRDRALILIARAHGIEPR